MTAMVVFSTLTTYLSHAQQCLLSHDSVMWPCPAGRSGSASRIPLMLTCSAFAGCPDCHKLSVSLGTALTAHLADVPWMAKNFVWLAPHGNCSALQALQVGRQRLCACAAPAVATGPCLMHPEV